MKIKHIKDFTENDLNDLFDKSVVDLEPIANAHYLMSEFYDSSINIRKNKNPFGIKYKQMFDVFGKENFIDDYKGSTWWILEFDNEKYAVDVNPSEGSQIYKFVRKGRNYVYDKKFSTDMRDFYNELFNIL